MTTIVPDPDVRLGPFTTDDVVASTIEIPYETEDGTPVDLSGAVPSTTLIAPDGSTAVATSTIVAGILEVDLPAVPFEDPGEWTIATTFTYDSGNVLTAPGVRFVVEDVSSGWLTIHTIRLEWRDAPSSDVVLWRLLEVARLQVDTYTPEPKPLRPATSGTRSKRTRRRSGSGTTSSRSVRSR